MSREAPRDLDRIDQSAGRIDLARERREPGLRGSLVVRAGHSHPESFAEDRRTASFPAAARHR